MKKEPRLIQLPKGYISYSQLTLWQANQQRYKDMYFDGRYELNTSNAGQEYGKIVADALENELDTGDVLTDSAMLILPKYDVRDKEIRANLDTKDGRIIVLGKPDAMNSETKDFYEYKTGKNPWTKKKAQNHLQMHFYAMVIYLAYGVLLKEAKLVWIETEILDGFDEEGFAKKIVKPTGRVEAFPVVFTLNEILETMALTAKVCQEIEIAYAHHTPNPKYDW
jgi:hypothetical protein